VWLKQEGFRKFVNKPEIEHIWDSPKCNCWKMNKMIDGSFKGWGERKGQTVDDGVTSVVSGSEVENQKLLQ
jgi:hypothetical protein